MSAEEDAHKVHARDADQARAREDALIDDLNGPDGAAFALYCIAIAQKKLGGNFERSLADAVGWAMNDGPPTEDKTEIVRRIMTWIERWDARLARVRRGY